MSIVPPVKNAWPALPLESMAPTIAHLHRLSQIAGKYAIDLPYQPNWGGVSLPITPRGFSTPLLRSGDVLFQITFALLDDRVEVTSSNGTTSLPLAPGSVAAFYARFVDAVAPLGIPPPRTTMETEIPDALHFEDDTASRPYDRDAARCAWSALASASDALVAWQAPYIGPRTQVGIMWGGFDLYAPRYTGRPVKPPSGKPAFMQNGMCAEVVAVGFSFGDAATGGAYMYAYITPPPDGLASRKFGVDDATWNPKAGLIVLPWDSVRASADPRSTIIAFADGVYEAAVVLGGWPREYVGIRCDGWYASKNRVP